MAIYIIWKHSCRCVLLSSSSSHQNTIHQQPVVYGYHLRLHLETGWMDVRSLECQRMQTIYTHLHLCEWPKTPRNTQSIHHYFNAAQALAHWAAVRIRVSFSASGIVNHSLGGYMPHIPIHNSSDARGAIANSNSSSNRESPATVSLGAVKPQWKMDGHFDMRSSRKPFTVKSNWCLIVHRELRTETSSTSRDRHLLLSDPRVRNVRLHKARAPSILVHCTTNTIVHIFRRTNC